MATIWRWYKKRTPVEKTPRVQVPAEAERRGPTRHPVNASAVLNLIAISHRATRSVRIQDISTNGVGLTATAPVDLGAFFVLEIGRSPVVRLKGRVVRLMQIGKGRWVVGGVFLTELTEAELSVLLKR
jgi:hypothetical protein